MGKEKNSVIDLLVCYVLSVSSLGLIYKGRS